MKAVVKVESLFLSTKAESKVHSFAFVRIGPIGMAVTVLHGKKSGQPYFIATRRSYGVADANGKKKSIRTCDLGEYETPVLSAILAEAIARTKLNTQANAGVPATETVSSEEDSPF